MEPVYFKRGGTFKVTGQYLENGQPAPLPQGVRAQVRRVSGELLAETDIQLVDANTGKYEITVLDTAGWPIDWAEYDVLYTYSTGVKDYTPTIKFKIVEAITHD